MRQNHKIMMLTLTAILACFQVAVNGCTSGFMDLDLLIKRASKIAHGDGKSQNGLNSELCLIPDMSFSCNGTISGLLLGATTSMNNNRSLYPEVQLWRKSATEVFIRRARQEIRLNPGGYSSDGVLQYYLDTPMSFQSGDVLGVYQPHQSNSIATLYYYNNSNVRHNSSYCTNSFGSPGRTTLQYLTEKQMQILISPITESVCSNNFPTYAVLRQQILEVNINTVIVRGRQQRIFPDIAFTCNGFITKWIVGARHRPRNFHLPELQIWRQNVDSQFVKIGFDLFEPNLIDRNVYEYISNPPLEFQKGDILGVFQPIWIDSMTVIHYQQGDGPVNRALYNQDFAPCTISSAYMYFNFDYPLVSVKISTGAASAGIRITSKSKNAVATKSETIISSQVQAAPTALAVPPRTDAYSVAVMVYPVVSVVMILVSNAVIVLVMIFVFVCWTRKRNSRSNTYSVSPTGKGVDLQKNVCYALPKNDIKLLSKPKEAKNCTNPLSDKKIIDNIQVNDCYDISKTSEQMIDHDSIIYSECL